MDFVKDLKDYLRKSYKQRYEEYSEMSRGLKLEPEPYETYIERIFNQEINCGGYALEIDACVFKFDIPFENAVTSLLEEVSFIRLLGNTPLGDDEYIVKYRAGEKLGHHFVKIRDGIATEKNACSEVRKFTDWADSLKDCPEAVFAVKKEHDIQLRRNDIVLDEGKDFDDIINEAYKNKQNNFTYHCQNYSLKKDNKSNSIYIYSDNREVGELLIEGEECISVINDGFKDYVSNTKTNYSIGKEEKAPNNNEHEIE